MDSRAVEHAKDQLELAEQAFEKLKAADDYKSAERAWTDFIMASARLYSKLEQGAKGYGKSDPWFGRKKHERRHDPLLRYLRHARNSAEHGIEYVVARIAGDQLAIGGPLKFGEQRKFLIHKLDEKKNPVGEPVEAMQEGPTIRLVRVHDTVYGDNFDPPKEHLGTRVPYSGVLPQVVGELGLVYFRQLVSEAEEYVGDSKVSTRND
jgi:hypothetical protein